MRTCLGIFGLLLHLVLLGCGDDDEPASDGGDIEEDGGTGDAGDGDSGTDDAGDRDSGTSDAGDDDAGTSDAGEGDAGTSVQIGDVIEGEAASDGFGASVALSADGTRLIAGATGNSEVARHRGPRACLRARRRCMGAARRGSRRGSRRRSLRRLVAISNDGTRVAVGSYLNDGGGLSSGHVRVFDLAGDAWEQVGADIDGPLGRGAGWAVALSADGRASSSAAQPRGTMRASSRSTKSPPAFGPRSAHRSAGTPASSATP